MAVSPRAVMPNRHPFYRSPISRWAFLVSGLFVTGTLWPGVPSWHDSPSLEWLHVALPWPVMFGAFTVYCLLLAFGSLRFQIVADFLGVILYGGDFVALTFTLGGHPTNGLGVAAIGLAALFHGLAGRLALYQWWLGDETTASHQ